MWFSEVLFIIIVELCSFDVVRVNIILLSTITACLPGQRLYNYIGRHGQLPFILFADYLWRAFVVFLTCLISLHPVIERMFILDTIPIKLNIN